VFSCQTTRIPREAYFWAEPVRLRNSDRFRSLIRDGNVLPAVISPQSGLLLGCNADGQIFSAFSPSALDDKTAVLAGHPHQKTVGSFT
jgi:hypothetical protein